MTDMKVSFVLLSLVISFAPSFSSACMIWPSANEMKKKSDVVFSGKVHKLSCNSGKRKITFKVFQIWKGDKASEYSLYYGKCPLIKGNDWAGEYLIFSRLNSNKEFESKPSLGGDCGHDIQKINSWIFDWLSMQYNSFKLGSGFLWTLSTNIGSNSDIENLGQPTYKLTGKK